jgi:kynurenine formamidase
LALVKEGRVYDLDCGRFPGMPVYEGHAPFMVLNYRTGRGLEAQGDHRWWLDRHGEGNNAVCFGWQSEVLIHSTHSGTHIDSLAHVTRGPDHHWFGGANEERDLGDFGPLRWDASTIPPIVTRGVLVDLPRARDLDALPAHAEVGREEVEGALERQGTTVGPGDVVLLRTGYLAYWPRPQKEEHFQAGINVEAAELLADLGAVAIGADTEGLENQPSRVEGNAFPVHLELLVERGVHILEMVFLEELARDGVYEFAFVCLPLKITGATGSLIRPIAMV